MKIGKRIIRDLPCFDLATVEASHDLVRRDLQQAVDLTQIASEADQISLNKR